MGLLMRNSMSAVARRVLLLWLRRLRRLRPLRLLRQPRLPRSLSVIEITQAVMVACMIALGSSAAWAEGAPRGTSDLESRIKRVLARKVLKNASVGIHVVRASDGQPVYGRGSDALLIPASNQKILTALAALERFGPTHRFSTRVWAPAPPNIEGVVDELIVQGGGDPAMNSEDWWRLAADLRREGLRGVKGDVRVDDSHFDGPGWHPSWGRPSSRAYHAAVGALTANYGTFFVSIWPQKDVGSSVLVDVDPPVKYLRVRNQARTAARGTRPKLSVGRDRGRQTEGPPEEIVQVSGVARQGDQVDRFPRSVLDPGLYAGSVLAYQLGANGVFVDGAVGRSSAGPAGYSLILDRPGRTVAEAVQLCMKYSNNSIAETLVKNLGAWAGTPLSGDPARQGTWPVGIRAVREGLGRMQVDLSEANLVDGSGLSIQNRVTPRVLVQALSAGQSSFAFGPEFMASFPIAERDGTLEKRLRGKQGRIRAKTGLLSDAKVTALSGFAERQDGETLIFSILVNGHSGSSRGAMDAVDEIAAALADADLGSLATPKVAARETP
ncbi:MAG: D-alanyl-D-alanine carboxypeptidase/D-alanyl-D-alanine-endopeptidase [Myxococcota bacterium]